MNPRHHWASPKLWCGILCAGIFGLYLHTLGPTLVPYRDAGEMATSITKLGILHPPGYPSYTLIGHLFTSLPIANPAYRLNLLSALAMALAWGVLFLLICELWGLTVGLLTVLLGAVSYQFWIHSLVSEMYTLNLLVLSGMLWLLHRRQYDAAAFLFGLGLGARMDLVLCAPAFLALILMPSSGSPSEESIGRRIKERVAPFLGRWFGFFLLGASVFFYLWIRANAHPSLNWGDPSTLERFWASLVRRSYGSTLDLLSQSYRAGENFWPEFQLYVRHLGRDFSLLSFPLSALGVVSLWRMRRGLFWAVALGWLFTGPLFIFLGNLPPNPHAVAIMEAAYLAPDLFFLLSIGAGLAWLARRRAVFAVTGVTLALVIAAQAQRFYPIVTKRHNWIAADYIRHVFYSVPEPSLIVARSDVPIFGLFYGHWIYPRFKWRVPVAQGLAGSPWYQVMMARQIPKLQLGPLQTAAEWEALYTANPGWSLFGAQSSEWPSELYPRMLASGLLLRYLPRGTASVIASDTLLSDFAVYRGRYRYDAYREFFSPQLIEEYAKGWMEWGRLLMRSRKESEAIDAFMRALTFKPDMPYPAFQLAFIYFQQNKLPEADRYYRWCVDSFQKMHRQAEEWKSFAALREELHRDEAQATAHWGVVQERMGNPDRAEALYKRALQVDPVCADARYNLSVIYWRAGRWQDVVEQLQALSAAHPEDPRWRAYLPQALERQRAGEQRAGKLGTP